MDDCFNILFSLNKVKVASDHLINLFSKQITENGQGVGSCFIDFSSSFSTYFDYIIEYHHSIGKFHDLVSKTTDFSPFLGVLEGKLQDTLETVLVTPVQRPIRYRILLQELIKCSDPDSPDLPNLNKALQIINDAISKVDEKLASSEEGNMKAEIEQKCPEVT